MFLLNLKILTLSTSQNKARVQITFQNFYQTLYTKLSRLILNKTFQILNLLTLENTNRLSYKNLWPLNYLTICIFKIDSDTTQVGDKGLF